MPHEDAAQDTAYGHHRNVMAGASLDNATGAHCKPELRQHRNNAHKEAGHPECIKQGPGIHVCVEESRKHQGP